MAADALSIFVDGMDLVMEITRPMNPFKPAPTDGRPEGYTDEELDCNFPELEALTRDEVISRLQALPKTHRLRRLLLSPLVRAEPLESIVIADTPLKFKNFLLLVWYLANEDHAVRAIVLQECGLKDKHGLALASALPKCTALKTLNLDNNKQLHDLGLAALCRAMGEGGTVHVFVAQNCDFADVGGYLGRCLIAKNGAIRRIDVSGNRVCAPGVTAHMAPALADSLSLEDLDLHDNRIEDHGLVALLEALGTRNIVLEQLKVGQNGITSASGGALGRMLRSNHKLHTLWLQKNKLGDGGVHGLAVGAASNKALRDLRLNQNDIGDRGAEALSAALLGRVPETLKSKKQRRKEKRRAKGRRLRTLERQIKKADAEARAAATSDLEAGQVETADETGDENDDDNDDNNDDENESGGSASEDDGDDENEQNDEEPQLPVQAGEPILLHKLALQDNFIDDRGAKALATAFAASPELRIVNLGRNRFSEAGGTALGLMLASNASIESFNCEGNAMGDAAAIAFADGLRDNRSCRSLNLSRNNISARGAEMLGQMLSSAQNITLKQLLLDGNPIEGGAFKDGWLGRAARRGVTGPSQVNLEISVDGTTIARGSQGIFGVKIPVSETLTRFSWFLLGLAVITNWVDLTTDLLVVSEFYESGRNGSISFAWFIFSLSFAVFPTLWITFFMADASETEQESWRTRLKNGLLSLTQMRVAYEAVQSFWTHSTTERFGSIRIAEVVGESGPQAFLQINFLVSSLGREGGADQVADAVVLLSVALSLLVLGQTFSDLFDKEFIQLRTSGLQGFPLFVRLLPCWVFHICQLSFRALTIALLATIFHPAIAAVIVLFFVAIRFAILRLTRSARRWQFAILVTFLANSAWDKRAAVLLGIFVSTLEAAGALLALWLSPDGPLSYEERTLPWAAETDFEAIGPLFMTSLMSSLLVAYLGIFAFYIYPLHEYASMAEAIPEAKISDMRAQQRFNRVVDALDKFGKQHRAE